MSKSAPARFLIVEDHLEFAEATAEFLRRLGMDVCIADCSKDGLQVGPVFRPDVILCDLRLPDMSGVDAAHAFRADLQTRGSLIVVCTAMSEREVRKMQSEHTSGEVDLFLAKPITKEKVQRLIALLPKIPNAG